MEITWRLTVGYSTSSTVYYTSMKEESLELIRTANGLAGKKILDVGGGCGETAKFFLDNGADSVHVMRITTSAGDFCRQTMSMIKG